MTGLVTRPGGLCGHDGLVLDGGQPTERGLHAASVIGPFDPGHDRAPQFLAGGPLPAIEDVLLQQAEEGLHRRVVACRPDPPYRAENLVPVERSDELPGAKLRSATTVNNSPCNALTSGNSILQGCDGQAGLHPRADGVAHDPLAQDVLDRAEIQLPFSREMLGNVGEPELVRPVGSEIAAGEVVMHGRSGFLTRPRF